MTHTNQSPVSRNFAKEHPGELGETPYARRHVRKCAVLQSAKNESSLGQVFAVAGDSTVYPVITRRWPGANVIQRDGDPADPSLQTDRLVCRRLSMIAPINPSPNAIIVSD